MASTVKLQDGSVVTFKPHYTHKAEREYNAVITDGVTFRTEIVRNADGTPVINPKTGQIVEKSVPEGMKASNATKANEALVECLVEAITDAAGRTLPFSKEWLENLPQQDYDAIESHVLGMKKAVDDLKPRKDDDETGRESTSKK